MSEPQTKALTLQDQRIALFRQTLGNNIKAMSSLLPQNMRPERLARIAIVELQRNPALLNCTPASFLLSVLGSCALGLDLGGPLGQAYLVPYRDTCQLIPGYRGLIKLATNSGNVSRVTAEVVRVGDVFGFEQGTSPKLTHVRQEAPVGDDGAVDLKWRPGDVRLFYAVAFFSDGTTLAIIMHRWEVDRIRDMSPGFKNARNKADHPWSLHYEEMGKKTAIRRLAKLLPAAAERLQYAVAVDESAELGHPQGIELLPGMPELPEAIEAQASAGSSEESPKTPALEKADKTDAEKVRENALQSLIIEMGKRGMKTKEDQLGWINELLPPGRKVTSRKELGHEEVGHLMAQLKRNG